MRRAGGTGRFHGWLSIVLALTWALLPGCQPGGGDDDVSSDDDDDSGDPVVIHSTAPVDGANGVQHRTMLWVEFSDDTADVTVELREGAAGDGTPVPGDVTSAFPHELWWFDPHGDAPHQHLSPLRDYRWGVVWPGGEATLGFTTGDLGLPLDDAEGLLLGGTYAVDLASGVFVQPNLGELLKPYTAEVVVTLQVVGLDEASGSIEVQLDPTTPATVTGSWSNPSFALGPVDLACEWEYGGIAWHDLAIDGSFTPDGTAIEGMRVDGTLDTTGFDQLVDPGSDLGATCQLLASLGIECGACPGGGGPYCITVEILSVRADRIASP